MLSVTQTRFRNTFWLLLQTSCFASIRRYLYEGLRSRGANLLYFSVHWHPLSQNSPSRHSLVWWCRHSQQPVIILVTHYHNLSWSHKRGRQECIFQKIYLDPADKGPDRDLTAVPDSALIWASKNQSVVAFKYVENRAARVSFPSKPNFDIFYQHLCNLWVSQRGWEQRRCNCSSTNFMLLWAFASTGEILCVCTEVWLKFIKSEQALALTVGSGSEKSQQCKAKHNISVTVVLFLTFLILSYSTQLTFYLG